MQLQIFFMHMLLSFLNHPLVKFISFSSNLIKKFLVTLERLPVAPSCILSIERFNKIIINNANRNHILQMINYSFVNMNSLMHHPHQQR
jgi:hypothetical protein